MNLPTTCGWSPVCSVPFASTCRPATPRAAPQYSRAFEFDIKGLAGTDPVGVRGAKVYQHSIDGLSWEPTPIAVLTLTDACIAQFGADEAPRLGLVSSQGCGSSGQSLDDGMSGPLAAGRR